MHSNHQYPSFQSRPNWENNKNKLLLPPGYKSSSSPVRYTPSPSNSRNEATRSLSHPLSTRPAPDLPTKQGYNSSKSVHNPVSYPKHQVALTNSKNDFPTPPPKPIQYQPNSFRPPVAPKPPFSAPTSPTFHHAPPSPSQSTGSKPRSVSLNRVKSNLKSKFKLNRKEKRSVSEDLPGTSQTGDLLSACFKKIL